MKEKSKTELEKNKKTQLDNLTKIVYAFTGLTVKEYTDRIMKDWMKSKEDVAG